MMSVAMVDDWRGGLDVREIRCGCRQVFDRLAMGIALLVIAHGGGYCCGVVIREEGGVVIREEGDGCRWLLYGFHIL
ncbi:uncharacterized protein M6B38_408635 [Iris pallida]|uniref:Uncharacterized protein n=1 Tax=Iris pallida TaxID=29817 RepID=A0AAX6FP16_IRIPA|nr:uncharacterized protein M6B38_408635 [Iris pallida]